MNQMFGISLAGAINLLLVLSASGQSNTTTSQPGIMLGPSIQISADRPKAPHVESFLAISPKDPNQMIASSITWENGETISVVYFSRDGGRHWRRATSFGPGVPTFSGGDPAVYYDNTGAALFTSIYNPPDRFTRVWRSSDGGMKWDSVTSMPGGVYDRQYLAIDRSTGPYRDRVYFAGTVVVRQLDNKSTRKSFPAMGITHSTNQGRSFIPAAVVDAGFGGAADLLISSQGALIVPYQATLDLTPQPPRAFWTFFSQDGGRTFSVRPGLPFDRGPMSLRRRVSSSNIRAAIDESKGPFRDRIYVTWIDFANERYDIKVTHSDDLGLSWSNPVSVNDNTSQNDPSNVAIAVNRDGVVALVWNDRRDDPSDMCYRVYASASLDGGKTFLPNIRFNAQPTCFNTMENWAGSANVFSIDDGFVLTSVSDRFANGGETQGLAAGPDGRFHVTWNGDVSGVMQLWYTNFSVRGSVVTTTSVDVKTTQANDICRQTQPMNPGPQSRIVPDRRMDRTKDVSFLTSEPVIDFASKSISVKLAVKNNSLCNIAAPLTLVLDKIESDFTGLGVANAENRLTGEGAGWNLLKNRRELAPGEQTEAFVIQWVFDGRVAEPKHLLSQFVMHFKVFNEPNNKAKD